MRCFEREPGESAKAFYAFGIYRDLGPARNHRKVAEMVYGNPTASLRQIEVWSSKFDWVARAQVYDQYQESIRQQAIADYERKRGEDRAEREQRIQEELVSVKERLIKKLLTMATWPLEKRTVTEVDEDGNERVTNIYPARWSFNTVARAIEILDEAPDRLEVSHDALGFGQDPQEVEDRFRELIERKLEDAQVLDDIEIREGWQD